MMGVFGKLKPTRLVSIREASEPVVDVVFVHGLDGDATATWRFDAFESWHSWISAAVPDANLWSLAYGLRSSAWFGGSMALTDRAINVLATLDVELTAKRPIVFICHSYGGLLIKQMLRSATQTALEYAGFVDQVRGIVFLGTPHTGSGVADYALSLRPLLRSSWAVRELQDNAPLLRDLNAWFRNWAKDRSVSIRVYFESQSARGVRVVDETASDPGITGVTPVAVDANHFELSKPNEPDFRVRQSIALIAQIRQELPAPPGRSLISEILTAPQDRLPFVEARVRAILVKDPGNSDALSARAMLMTMKQASRRASYRPSPSVESPPLGADRPSPLLRGNFLWALWLFPLVIFVTQREPILGAIARIVEFVRLLLGLPQ